jgi:hypothetical protein
LVFLWCVLTRPFPPPQGSDTIPLACRPALPLNLSYAADPLPRSRLCPAWGPPDKSIFGQATCEGLSKASRFSGAVRKCVYRKGGGSWHP